jgi:ATP-dependent DNA helicase RecQ
MERPLIDKLIHDDLLGTACVITKSNEDTLKILNLLNNKNIPAKLIQSLDSFKLTNLYEIKNFIDFIKQHDDPITISNELWAKSVENLKIKFEKSILLPIILNALKDYEYINETKYLSDLETFFNESKLEDFYEDDNKTITISTIHKAKGREYNNVYFMAKDYVDNDENKREFYVAMTRAKDSLNIFYNQNMFDKFKDIKGIQYSQNMNEYSEPAEIILQTSLKDVFLDSFKNKKDFILHLRSGWQINVKDNALYFRDKKIGLFSKKFKEDLNKYYEKKYKIIKATIQFIVYWKGDEEDTEFPIILPELKLKKISK